MYNAQSSVGVSTFVGSYYPVSGCLGGACLGRMALKEGGNEDLPSLFSTYVLLPLLINTRLPKDT